MNTLAALSLMALLTTPVFPALANTEQASNNEVSAVKDQIEASSAAALAAQSDDWTIYRVGGNTSVLATFDEAKGEWASGSSKIDTALPEGYPAPTPPGAIELKKYPSVRRAEITSANSDTEAGFWPLFRHIERNEIAMTSPVEYDYHGMEPSSPEVGEWTMSFLYRTPELRETGADESDDRVRVVDTEPLTVVSLGGRGSYSMSRVTEDIEVLNQWLGESPEWEAAGEPRSLMYNGPTLFQNRKWLEVQIPVRRTDSGAGSESNS